MPPTVLVTLRITILAHRDAGGRGIQPISGNQQIEFLDKIVGIIRYRDGTVIDVVRQVKH